MATVGELTPNIPAGPEAVKPGRFPILVSFRYREYRYLWIGTTFSATAFWASMIASLWLMRQITDSFIVLGLVGFLTTIPTIIISPYAGAVADRVNRKRLLIVTRLLALVPPTVMGVLALTGTIQAWQILAGTLAMGLVQAVDLPPRSSLVPVVVPRVHLMNAFALQAAVWSVTQILGPAVGAFLLTIGTGSFAYFFAAASALVTLWTVTQLSATPVATEERGSTFAAVKEGIVFAGRHPVIRVVIVLGLLTGLTAMPFQILLPIFANDVFAVGPLGYGWMQMTAGFGALIGTLLLAGIVYFSRQNMLLVISMVAFGAGLILLGLAPTYLFALLFMVLIGASMSTSHTLMNTVTQNLTPDTMRGRVTSFYMLTWGMSSFGSLVLGAMADVMGVHATVAVSGILVAAAGLVAYAVFPAFRAPTT